MELTVAEVPQHLDVVSVLELPDPRGGPEPWRRLGRGADIAWAVREQTWAALSPAAIHWVLANEPRFSAGRSDLQHGFLLTSDGDRHRRERQLFARHFGQRIVSASESMIRGEFKSAREAADLIAGASGLCRDVWRVIFAFDAPDNSLVDLVQHVKGGRRGAGEIEGELMRQEPLAGLLSDLQGTLPRAEAVRQASFLAVALSVAILQTLPGAAILAAHRKRLAAEEGELIDLKGADDLLAQDSPLLGLFRFASATDEFSQLSSRTGETPIQLCWVAANQRRDGAARSWTFGAGRHACPARNLALFTVQTTVNSGMHVPSPLLIDGATLPHVRMPLLQPAK